MLIMEEFSKNLGAKKQLLSWQDALSILDSTFADVKQLLLSKIGSLSNNCVLDHVQQVLEHNVPHGKKTRAATVLVAYSAFSEHSTNPTARVAASAAWAVELLQASFLVHDDIMDSSLTRRGQSCWYRVDGIGLGAVNDGILLNEFVYSLLQSTYSLDTCNRLHTLLHEVTLKTSLGQSMDWQLASRLKRQDPGVTLDQYFEMIRYKTAYYSFVLPVCIAICLKNLPKSLEALAEKLLLPIGEFFQAQDDYLDCFGNADVMGKIGTDIEEGKCSWLAMQFLQQCRQRQKPEELDIFWANFGSTDQNRAHRVRELYISFGMQQIFDSYQVQTIDSISASIDAAAAEAEAANDHQAAALCSVCLALLQRISHRSS